MCYYTWKYPDFLTKGIEQITIMVSATIRRTPDKYANPGTSQPISDLSVKSISAYVTLLSVPFVLSWSSSMKSKTVVEIENDKLHVYLD